MIDSLTINEVVRRTGLTSRALRFYEARGLLSPLRTGSGRRVYSAAQIERIHQIVTLKKAGLSLSQIGRLFDNKPLDLAHLLRGQLAVLSAEADEIAMARNNLETALSRIDSGEPLDAATLCSLVKDGEENMTQENWKQVIDRYYTPEEQAHWLENAAPILPEFSSDKYLEQWKELSGRIEAALPMPADSEQALAFVREWFALLEPFSKVATPEMWEGTAKLYQSMPEWEGQIDPGFSSNVWQFISQATTAARAAGHDIGPLPAWMS
ncbi:MerR family transcriptional regulator [Parasphingorhabdus sp.]|uniref:MerR family transcriptional regulator n=1 Tax=Parasphingorhabdus sp. TaxID=2709688 RepID=UPI003A931A3B